MSNLVTHSVLLPHPPILIPEVAGSRLRSCQATHDASRLLARRVVDSAPSLLVLVSPHSPRRPASFGLWGGERLRGDLSRFGAGGAAVDLPSSSRFAALLHRAAEENGLVTWNIPPGPLDHGAVVPLWFLCQAGWQGPTLIASLPSEPEMDACRAFGRLIGRALEVPTALIASGDMSHRCTPDAPAGFHPEAADFDRELVQLIAEGRFDLIPSLDPERRRHAAEDTIDATLVVTAASGLPSRGAEVLSYEHPFGVGYLVASLHA